MTYLEIKEELKLINQKMEILTIKIENDNGYGSQIELLKNSIDNAISELHKDKEKQAENFVKPEPYDSKKSIYEALVYWENSRKKPLICKDLYVYLLTGLSIVQLILITVLLYRS